MFHLLNRITWVLCILIAILFLFVDEDLFLIGIVVAIVIKFALFSPNYIRSRLEFFRAQLLKTDIPKIQSQFSDETTVGDIPQETVLNENNEYKEDLEELESEVFIAAQPQQDTEEETSYQAAQQYEHTPSEPREPNAIERFFSENLLAKIGGILVFLGVLFFLSLIYAVIGPVAKICIGFIIGFSFYAAGVWLDKRGSIGESRIVMGVAILINYLVILSGRHILGDDSSIDGSTLSVGVTFLFLVLNTIFAVFTSLIYNSRPLLIFAFIFAYLNPSFLGVSSDEPYTLLGYTMIVTLGALFMSYTRKDKILFPLTFVLASTMFLAAPGSDASAWVTKLLCINTLGALSLYCSTAFQKYFQNITEILICGTFFLIGFLGLLGLESLSNIQMIIMGASSLGLMAFCYISSNKGAYLYSIGTLGSIVTLAPAIYTNGLTPGMIGTSTLIIVVFALMNLGFIMTKGKDFIADNLSNIIFGLLTGSLFLTGMIYFFGTVFFPGMLLGFAFFGLAIVYCSLAFMIVSKIGIETIKTNQAYENTFYTISAIGVSLFSLAVAFVFAENKEIVSIIWLLEANVLFFLASKTQSTKVSAAGMILFIIGVLKLLSITSPNIFGRSLFTEDYGILVALIIVLCSLICNLALLFNKPVSSLSSEFYGLHNVFHIIAMSIIILTGHQIFDITTLWYVLLYFSVSITALGVLYHHIKSPGLQTMHLLAYLGFMAIHIFVFVFSMSGGNVDFFTSTMIAIIYALPFISDIVTKGSIKSKSLFVVFVMYAFLLSTLYVYEIFDVTFAITLYWGILAFILLGYGISKDILPLRTVGLYLISLTAGKVFFYDIWMSVDDTISRVVALMVVGILMIVLSTMYTRKYGNTLNSEFNLSNLFPENNSPSKITVGEVEMEPEEKSKIQTDIESIDISGISSVKLHVTGDEKPVQIRAKNLIKMSKLIANTYQKTEFKPFELKAAFSMIDKDYKSSLSPAQYKRIKDLVAQFVEKGGSIEFIK